MLIVQVERVTGGGRLHARVGGLLLSPDGKMESGLVEEEGLVVSVGKSGVDTGLLRQLGKRGILSNIY